MSTGLMKQLLYGKNFSLYGPADFLHLLEEWGSEIAPESFRPLIPFTGGMSLLAGDDRGTQAILFGGDWLGQCRDAGANAKNAVICLASNFADHAGIVAFALELAMIAMKPKTPDDLRIDERMFLEIFEEVFLKNYAGIQVMARAWGLDADKVSAMTRPPGRTRPAWRSELGHDVLIHPVTLDPCRDEGGSALEYGGTVHDKDTDKCSFMFKRRATGEQVLSQVFLPVPTA